MRITRRGAAGVAGLLLLAGCGGGDQAAAPEPADPVPYPSADAEGTAGEEPVEEPVEAAPEVQPIDGGVYTWSSGITMRTSIEHREPYGATDDFCGDGSCGVVTPDDTRVVIKYEVTVPESYTGPVPFDPSFSCPGQFTVASGNDEAAGGGVVGTYYAPIQGPMMPGSTKYGIEERWVDAAYADSEYYLTSTCGDPDYSGESAIFSGVLGSETEA